MASRETPAARGARRARMLRGRLSTELGDTRRYSGLSIREVARAVGVSPDTIICLETGEQPVCTIDLIAKVAEVVGLQLASSLHPNGDPVRDRGHLALINRFRNRLGTGARVRVEVAVPIAGDLRSGDGMVTVAADGGPADVLIEAETHLGDLQLLERRAGGKQRDLGAKRLLLLVADTRHNKEVICLHPELRERFPIGARRALASLVRGEDPGGDCLIML